MITVNTSSDYHTLTAKVFFFFVSWKMTKKSRRGLIIIFFLGPPEVLEDLCRATFYRVWSEDMDASRDEHLVREVF